MGNSKSVAVKNFEVKIIKKLENQLLPSESDFVTIFENYDKNKDGFISPKNVETLMKELFQIIWLKYKKNEQLPVVRTQENLQNNSLMFDPDFTELVNSADVFYSNRPYISLYEQPLKYDIYNLFEMTKPPQLQPPQLLPNQPQSQPNQLQQNSKTMIDYVTFRNGVILVLVKFLLNKEEPTTLTLQQRLNFLQNYLVKFQKEGNSALSNLKTRKALSNVGSVFKGVNSILDENTSTFDSIVAGTRTNMNYENNISTFTQNFNSAIQSLNNRIIGIQQLIQFQQQQQMQFQQQQQQQVIQLNQLKNQLQNMEIQNGESFNQNIQNTNIQAISNSMINNINNNSIDNYDPVIPKNETQIMNYGFQPPQVQQQQKLKPQFFPILKPSQNDQIHDYLMKKRRYLLNGYLKQVSGNGFVLIGVNEKNIVTIYDIKNQIWVDQPVKDIKGKKLQFRYVDIGMDNTVIAVTTQYQCYRLIWDTTTNNNNEGQFQFLKGSWKKFPGSNVKQVAIGSKDHIWILTTQGEVYQWNFKNPDQPFVGFLKKKNGLNINFISINSQGSLFATVGSGVVYYFDYKKDDWVKFPHGMMSKVFIGEDNVLLSVKNLEDFFVFNPIKKEYQQILGGASSIAFSSLNQSMVIVRKNGIVHLAQ